MAVAELYEDIPTSISAPVLTFVAEKRQKLERLMYFQAYYLQRRIAKVPKEADVIFGMLIQIKLFLHSVSNEKVSNIPEDTLPSSHAEESRQAKEALDKALEGVETFKKAGAK